MAGEDITTLLRRWGDGDRAAGDDLFPLIYDELRRLARHRGAFDAGQTLQATALVNEAFVELAGDLKTDWRDRAQFFAFAAVVMRRLMVDYSRRKRTEKRGGDLRWVEFDESIHALESAGIDFEALDEALTRLAELDPTQARIVELRFFGGLSVDEAAEHLGIAPRTVNRQWGLAKAWLAGQLGPKR